MRDGSARPSARRSGDHGKGVTTGARRVGFVTRTADAGARDSPCGIRAPGPRGAVARITRIPSDGPSGGR